MRVIAADEHLNWSVDGSKVDQYYRLYFYATAFPEATTWIVRGQRHSISIGADGTIGFYAGPNFTNKLALNQWVRFEYHLQNPGSGMTLKYFADPDSSTPTETQNGPQSAGAESSIQFGINFGPWGNYIWFDNLVANADSWPGPYVAGVEEEIQSPVAYTVRDYFGKIVSEGVFEEYHHWFRPLPPAEGWTPGWYRVYLTGLQSDVDFADSYGATNFCVIRSDSHFPSMPAASTSGGTDVGQDFVMKGVMGLGTSRLTVLDAASPNIPNLQSDLAITRTYWADLADPERPAREPWVQFSGATSSGPQQAGVTSVVAALYPDCKYFEGPSNEPFMGAGTAADMATFAAAVHAGNANAQAIGPCFVDITNLSGWDDFLAAGGGDHCDGISFHAYNAVTNGNLNLGKSTIQAFLDLLASYGLEDKVLWQTESVHAITSVYGIYHPRRARKPLLETLLFEQKGIPWERNNWWYDLSHGFWNFPSFSENADGSLNPEAVLGRVLAEEIWGKPFVAAVDFGTTGNDIFVGNLYTGSTGSVIAFMPTSFIEGASVSFFVSSVGMPITYVDSWGNETSQVPPQRIITVPVTEAPSYLELPSGVTADVYAVNDWPPIVGLGSSLSPSAVTKEMDSASYPVLADNAFLTNSAAGTGHAPTGTFAQPPSVIDLLWDSVREVSRVIIWSGMCWQDYGAPVEFEIQTTLDGIAWTTQKTVTRPALSYFNFGTDESNAGCLLETFWDEQWVFDVPLDQTETALGIRINVLSSSYGGEPLPAPDFGQGNSVEGFTIEEIGVFFTESTPVGRHGGGAPPKDVVERKAGLGEVTYQSYIILSG